jgi:threonine/homoserine/homoserine lactone efflux protein
MLAIDTALSFFVVATLLSLAPGPDNLFVLAQSGLYGARSGLAVIAGLCSGLVVHTLLVTLGVAALIQASMLTFTLIKICGAGYLLYLAWQAFKASSQSNSDTTALNLMQLYRRGVLMNLTNPKVTVFFLALLPQFVDPTQGLAWLQLLQLGGLFILAALMVFSAIALLAAKLSVQLRRSPAALSWLNRISATLFIGLAVRLAWTER